MTPAEEHVQISQISPDVGPVFIGVSVMYFLALCLISAIDNTTLMYISVFAVNVFPNLFFFTVECYTSCCFFVFFLQISILAMTWFPYLIFFLLLV